MYVSILSQFRLFIPREEKAMISPHLPFKIYLCINPKSFSITEEIYTYKSFGPCTVYTKCTGATRSIGNTQPMYT